MRNVLSTGGFQQITVMQHAPCLRAFVVQTLNGAHILTCPLCEIGYLQDLPYTAGGSYTHIIGFRILFPEGVNLRNHKCHLLKCQIL